MTKLISETEMTNLVTELRHNFFSQLCPFRLGHQLRHGRWRHFQVTLKLETGFSIEWARKKKLLLELHRQSSVMKNRPFLLNFKCGKEKSQCRKVFPARVHLFSVSRCFCGNFWMRLAREGQPNSEISTKTPRFRKEVNEGWEWFSAHGLCFSTEKLSRSSLFLSRGYFLHKRN